MYNLRQHLYYVRDVFDPLEQETYLKTLKSKHGPVIAAT